MVEGDEKIVEGRAGIGSNVTLYIYASYTCKVIRTYITVPDDIGKDIEDNTDQAGGQ